LSSPLHNEGIKLLLLIKSNEIPHLGMSKSNSNLADFVPPLQAMTNSFLNANALPDQFPAAAHRKKRCTTSLVLAVCVMMLRGHYTVDLPSADTSDG
jgi:hypothetical protein